jgi:hypothetical protein
MCKYNFCFSHWVQGHVLERGYLAWEAIKIKDNIRPKGYCSNGTILTGHEINAGPLALG